MVGNSSRFCKYVRSVKIVRMHIGVPEILTNFVKQGSFLTG